jgi:hypothetical protein
MTSRGAADFFYLKLLLESEEKAFERESFPESYIKIQIEI